MDTYMYVCGREWPCMFNALNAHIAGYSIQCPIHIYASIDTEWNATHRHSHSNDDASRNEHGYCRAIGGEFIQCRVKRSHASHDKQPAMHWTHIIEAIPRNGARSCDRDFAIITTANGCNYIGGRKCMPGARLDRFEMKTNIDRMQSSPALPLGRMGMHEAITSSKCWVSNHTACSSNPRMGSRELPWMLNGFECNQNTNRMHYPCSWITSEAVLEQFKRTRQRLEVDLRPTTHHTSAGLLAISRKHARKHGDKLRIPWYKYCMGAYASLIMHFEPFSRSFRGDKSGCCGGGCNLVLLREMQWVQNTDICKLAPCHNCTLQYSCSPTV